MKGLAEEYSSRPNQLGCAMENATLRLKRGHWEPCKNEYRFAVGGRIIKSWTFSGLMLMEHFSGLSTTLEDTVPYWQEFPQGIEVAVVADQPVNRDHKRLTFFPQYIRTISSKQNRYYVKLAGSFEEYLRKFGSKSRKNLNRTIKRFKELAAGLTECREYSSPQEIERFCDLADQISRKSWQGQLLTKLFTERFTRSGIVNSAAEEKSRGYVLFHGERPIAYVLCEMSQDVFFYRVPGFDQDYEQWSPGTVLLLRILERLYSEKKYRLLDFGYGMEPYKKFFSTDYTPCVTVRYFKRSVKNTYITIASHFLNTCSLTVGRLLKKLWIEQEIKMLVRGRRYSGRSVEKHEGDHTTPRLSE